MITVTYTDTVTGEIATKDHDLEPSASWWSDGNGSCDCNRADFFIEALLGIDADEMDADTAKKYGFSLCLHNGGYDYPCDHGVPRYRVKVCHGAVVIFDDYGWNFSQGECDEVGLPEGYATKMEQMAKDMRQEFSDGAVVIQCFGQHLTRGVKATDIQTPEGVYISTTTAQH